MKRIFLALSLLGAAGMAFFVWSQRINHARRQLLAARSDWLNQEQRIAARRTEQEALDIKVRQLKKALQSTPAMLADTGISELLRTNGLNFMSNEMRQEFLARLGFAWNSSDNYVLVHKETLKTIRTPKLFTDGKLTDLPCAVLAITPEQRQRMDAAVEKTFGSWAKANLQREGPSGNTLVRFSIPGSAEVAQVITNQLYASIASIIGSERVELLGSLAGGWLETAAGYYAAVTNTLAVMQRPDGNGGAGLLYQLNRNQNTAPRKIDPKNFPFPWKIVFPGGWQELAQREGFDLLNAK